MRLNIIYQLIQKFFFSLDSFIKELLDFYITHSLKAGLRTVHNNFKYMQKLTSS